VLPRVDALNATDRDAVTVFRLFSTDYSASTNTRASSSTPTRARSRTRSSKAHRNFTRRRRR
jgi:hypothetical protein